jgi:hypothetical protein
MPDDQFIRLAVESPTFESESHKKRNSSRSPSIKSLHLTSASENKTNETMQITQARSDAQVMTQNSFRESQFACPKSRVLNPRAEAGLVPLPP